MYSRVWSVKCTVWSVNCAVSNAVKETNWVSRMEYVVWSVAYKVWSIM